MATIGSLVVSLIANTSLFDSNLRKSNSTLKSWMGQVASTQRVLVGFAKGAMAAAGIAGVGYMIKQTMESIDTTAKLSDRLNMATQDLVALQHAAKLNGMETETMNKSLETFVRRVGEAKLGSGQAADTFERLGLSAEKLSNTNQYENLKAIADQINRLPTAADKAAAAYDLFGRQGQQMLSLFQEGSAGLEAFRAEAERLGITFNRLDAAKVEAANDSIDRAKAKMAGFVQVLAVELAPTIHAVATKISNIGTSGEDMRTKIVASVKATTYGFAILGNMVNVVEGAMKTLAAVIVDIGTIAVSGFGMLAQIIEDDYNLIIQYQNKIADSWFGKRVGMGKMSEIDMTSDISAYASAMSDVGDSLWAGAGEAFTDLPTSKVSQWFEELEQQTANIKDNLESAAARTTSAADTIPIVDETEALEKVKNYIDMIRHREDMTRMERIEALKEYAQENASTLQQVAKAHEALNEEILNLEHSRVNQLKVYFAELREDMQESGLYMADKMATVAKSIESSMSGAFYGMMEEGKGFKESMVEFANEIRRAYMRMAADILARATMSGISNSLGSSFGNLFGGLFGGSPAGDSNLAMANIAHSGGVVGSLTRSRAVPASVFASAPRLHNGLLSDEFPAILQRGETVIPRGGGVATAVMQPPSVIINNNTGKAMKQDGKPSYDGRNWVVTVIADNIDQGGILRNKIKDLR